MSQWIFESLIHNLIIIYGFTYILGNLDSFVIYILHVMLLGNASLC